MAVAHSSASESHTGTTGSTNQTAFSWTHTQTGAPQGVLVFVHVANSTLDPVDTVTYGTVTLERVAGGAAVDSAGEAGRTDLFFAGSGLPSGNQTITVNRTSNAAIMYASAATVTAATDTNVTGIVLLQGDGTMAQQSVDDGTPGTDSLRYAAAYSGLNAPPTTGANSTSLTSIDFGNYTAAMVRETTAGQGSRSVGFTTASDDRAAVHVAVRELFNRTDNAVVGAFTLIGPANTLSKGRSMVGERGAFALTGQPADKRYNPRIDGGTGAFTFTGRAADTLHNVRLDGGTGAFSLTGNDATLSKAAAPSKTIAADRGQFTLTGNPASTLVAVQLGGDVGKFFLPERNQRQWSEEFSNAYWTKTNASIIANATTAPDGTLTADALIENTTPSTSHQVTRNYTYVTGKTYTYSCYFKVYPGPITRYVRLYIGSATVFGTDAYINLNLATGTITSTLGSPSATSITNEGNGWYRASITKQYTGAGATSGAAITLISNTGTALYTDADGLSGVYVWGAQWEESTSATDYDPTGAASATDTSLQQQYKLTAEVGAFAFTGNSATLAKGRTITAETGAFTATGQPATLLHNPRIEANTGSFALSGGAPALLRGRYLSGGAGTFIETGQPATFRRTWAVQAVTGTFTLTGNPAALTAIGAYEINPIVGAFTLAGQPANLAQSQTMPVDAGTFTLTGNQVATNVGHAVTGETGKFFLPERNLHQRSEEFNNAYWSKANSSVTANSTTAPDGTLTADTLIENTANSTHIISKSLAFTAGAKYTASLCVKTYQNRNVALVLGTTAVFGGTANTVIVFSPATNTILLTNNSPEAFGAIDVGNGWYRIYVTKTAIASATISSQIQLRTGITGLYTGDGTSGAYIWGAQWQEGDLSDYDPTGPTAATPAGLRRNYRIDGNTGAFTLSGGSLELRRAPRLTVDSGSFTLTGNAAAFLIGRTFVAERGTYALTGQAALLQRGISVATEVGAFAFIGQPSTFRADRFVSVESGSYVFTGQSVNLSDTDLINASVGTFALSGQAITLTKTRRRNVLIF